MALREPFVPGTYLRGLSPVELTPCDGASSFLQSGFWGAFKSRFGWNARGFLLDWGDGDPRPLLVLGRKLGPGISLAYVPWGPELPLGFPPEDGPRREALTELARALGPFLRASAKNTAFIRFDPPWYAPGMEAPVLGPPFRRAAADVQPPDTVLLDLAASPEEILGAMKPKWRYNIRLAEKKGVEVRRGDEAELGVFYALFRETARRDGIALHSLDYYRTLFALGREYPGERPDIRLYIARAEGEDLGAVITLFRGPAAVYLYGASSDRKRNLMAPYALQWRVMEDARAAGCREYDLFGIPPREDPEHPMAGLYRFKTGFGGTIIHRPGSWDYPYRPLMTGIFSAAEGLRKHIRSFRKR